MPATQERYDLVFTAIADDYRLRETFATLAQAITFGYVHYPKGPAWSIWDNHIRAWVDDNILKN